MALVAAASVGAQTVDAQAQSAVADFYRKNPIALNIGLAAGGGYDLYGRLLARHLSGHVPGNPTIVVRNKTGAGGMVLADGLHNVEPADGTSLGVLNQTAAIAQRLGYKGVRYDVTRFTWIGRIATGNETVVVWAASGIRTIDDAKKREVVMGATGISGTSAMYPLLLNKIVGTRFKIVTGFPGMSNTWIAMERGEIDGGSNSVASLRSAKADWLKDKKVNVLVQISLEKHPEFSGVPLLYELATNDLDRQVLRLFSSPPAIGRAITAPPGIPAERRDALRKAFDATMKDPQFLADAAKVRAEIEPLAGAELEKIVISSVQVSDEVVQRGKWATSR
jgi:tripartite-type tricarboxylate transporter receptor subunit TctC